MLMSDSPEAEALDYPADRLLLLRGQRHFGIHGFSRSRSIASP